MNRLVLFAALSGLLSLPITAQDTKPDKTKQAVVPAGAEKPVAYKLGSVVDEGLTLTDLAGKALTFEDLRGKVVFIHFWSKDRHEGEATRERFAEMAAKALGK